MPRVIGVDSSTQATKVEVRDADSGEVLSAGRAAHPPTCPPRSEQHPEAWEDALRLALAEAGVGDARGIGGVSVAGQQHGMVVLDERGQVIRPAKLWNDTESAPDAMELIERIGAPAWAARAGSVPVASFTVTKLAWLRRNEPAAFARLARVLLPHDWLTHRLTGGFVTDRGDASGTGYWSPAEGSWDTGLLALVDDGRDWTAALPDVLGPLDAAGQWREAVVAPGTGDNMAAAVGLGMRTGDIAVSLGTSGTVFAVSDRPVADATGTVAGFADATGRFLPLVCTLNATKVTDAFARVLGVSHAELDALALAEPPGARGLVVLPYLDGERTPNRPNATGVVAGVRSDVTRSQLARAAFEGVACGLLDGLDALARCGVSTGGRLFLIGGGARSSAYRQVVADLAGREVLVPVADEVVARGACVQAAAVLSGTPPEEIARTWALAAHHVEPSAAVDAAAVRDAYAAVRDATG